MTKTFVRMFSAAACAALFSLSSINAEVRQVSNVVIPFEFKVLNKMLPAGEYRVEQTAGSDIATMTNTTTGERVRILRPASLQKEGKTVLTFAPAKEGMKLKMS